LGKWTESVYCELSKNELQVIWRARAFPPSSEEMYGLTEFAIQLNEITPDIEACLPTTDTRLRPDQRLYECGRVEEAETEKLRLEEKQRQYRKQLEASGTPWKAQWFELKKDPYSTEGESWQYKGDYWDVRERKAFASVLNLFD